MDAVFARMCRSMIKCNWWDDSYLCKGRSVKVDFQSCEIRTRTIQNDIYMIANAQITYSIIELTYVCSLTVSSVVIKRKAFIELSVMLELRT